MIHHIIQLLFCQIKKQIHILMEPLFTYIWRFYYSSWRYKSYFPTKIYFTEQWTSSTGDFGGDLKWHLKNVVIGSMRNWSKIALEWNLANNSQFKPHTEGGCTMCKGAITINSSENFERNVAITSLLMLLSLFHRIL